MQRCIKLFYSLENMIIHLLFHLQEKEKSYVLHKPTKMVKGELNVMSWE